MADASSIGLALLRASDRPPELTINPLLPPKKKDSYVPTSDRALKRKAQ